MLHKGRKTNRKKSEFVKPRNTPQTATEAKRMRNKKTCSSSKKTQFQFLAGQKKFNTRESTLEYADQKKIAITDPSKKDIMLQETRT